MFLSPFFVLITVYSLEEPQTKQFNVNKTIKRQTQIKCHMNMVISHRDVR